MDKKERILDFFIDQNKKSFKLKELRGALVVSKDNSEALKELLNELVEEGKLYKNDSGKYGIPKKFGLISCKLSVNERGFGFAIPIDKEYSDIYISKENINGAMHNDIVFVKTNKKLQGGKRAEGQVVGITHRANKSIVGTFEKDEEFGFVVPDNKRITSDVFIPRKYFNNANDNQKVVCEIIKWPDKRRNPEGKIVEVLGDIDDPGVDVLSIIKEYNIDDKFPDEVLSEVKNIKEKIPEDEYKKRKDYTSLRTITIDGEDAKDLDDAISIKKRDDGKYDLYVHIADVTHYVKPKTYLDKEARKRGTSVYLIDRVIPMLPPKLSNGVCSLNAKVERLSFTCYMLVDKNGKVEKHDFSESIIKVNRRFSYKEVFGLLDKTEVDNVNKYADYMTMLGDMKELCKILQKKRERRGTIDFDFDEAEVILDEKGYPIEIVKKERTLANRIIEEFMILANETVASNFYHADIPFIYRVHEKPEEHKLMELNEYIIKFGIKIRNISDIKPYNISNIIKEVKGKAIEDIISKVVLRTQQKAKYSYENIGHFGLASQMYTHFTSPIRRYPDLYIHRIMKTYLSGKLKGKTLKYYEEAVKQVSKTTSEAEMNAEYAQRDSVDLKKVEYMKRHLKGQFKGIISNITNFGMFVELDNTVEGLVGLSDMIDDYYIYDEKNYALVGDSSGKRYDIGQEVEIVVTRVDLKRRQIDFMLKEIYDDIFGM